jgi:hypothetical protein
MKKDKIIFIHIPKTGGSTLQGIINREYGKKHTFNVKNNRKVIDFINLSDSKKNNINVLKGHMAFGHHNEFVDPNKVSYFTMLRDPIKRIISNYYFILKQKDHHTHQKIVNNSYSLKEYVESGIIANTENAQVRLLSNNIETPHGKCTTEMLEIAKKNLEKHFPVIGINEYFDETILFLQDKYNWKNPYYGRVNVTGHGIKPTDLNQNTLDVIRKYNSLDIELYEHSKTNFKNKKTGRKKRREKGKI